MFGGAPGETSPGNLAMGIGGSKLVARRGDPHRLFFCKSVIPRVFKSNNFVRVDCKGLATTFFVRVHCKGLAGLDEHQNMTPCTKSGFELALRG